MDWQLLVALLITVPIVLFPLAFITYLNVGGVYYGFKEKRFSLVSFFASVVKAVRIGLTILIPLAIYAGVIWYFYGHYSWQVVLIVALVMPVVLAVPALIWLAVVSGLFQVARYSLGRRASAPRRRVVRTVEERVVE